VLLFAPAAGAVKLPPRLIASNAKKPLAAGIVLLRMGYSGARASHCLL
jgi:hypothetical protein